MAARPMLGKLVLVTGATSGLGKETAVAMAEMGAIVVIHGRSEEKAETTAKEIRSRIPGAQVEVILADFAKLDDVRAMADEFRRRFGRLDVLVNNAGLMINKKLVTADGHEMMFQVNFLAPFLLTCSLSDLLERSAPSRIVNVTSNAHQWGSLDFSDIEFTKRFGGMRAYGRSKLQILDFTYELARRLKGKGVTANAVHPGFVRTNLGSGGSAWWRGGIRLVATFARRPKKGAETAVLVASSPELEGVTGKYFKNSHQARSSSKSHDEASWTKLWEMAERVVGEECGL